MVLKPRWFLNPGLYGREGVGSLLCVTSCVLDKFLMVAFTDTSKEINGTAKQNHVINKFGKGVHFWKLPSLSYFGPIVVSSWETILNECHHL